MTEATPSPSLDEERQQFYGAVGKAITQWQEVEEGLSMIFSAVIGYPNQWYNANASAAFHAVLNFETKLGMVDSAIEMIRFGSVLSPFQAVREDAPRIFEQWRTLHNRCGRRVKRRNELAHFMLAWDDSRRPGNRYYLRPNIVDARAWIRHGGRPPERNHRMIVATGDAFFRLGTDLKIFFTTWLLPRSPTSP